jgi:hypothetical protein
MNRYSKYDNQSICIAMCAESLYVPASMVPKSISCLLSFVPSSALNCLASVRLYMLSHREARRRYGRLRPQHEDAASSCWGWYYSEYNGCCRWCSESLWIMRVFGDNRGTLEMMPSTGASSRWGWYCSHPLHPLQGRGLRYGNHVGVAVVDGWRSWWLISGTQQDHFKVLTMCTSCFTCFTCCWTKFATCCWHVVAMCLTMFTLLCDEVYYCLKICCHLLLTMCDHVFVYVDYVFVWVDHMLYMLTIPVLYSLTICLYM